MDSHSLSFRRALLLPLTLVAIGGCPDGAVVGDPDDGSRINILTNDGYGPRPRENVLAGANNGTFRALSDELARHGSTTVVAGDSTTDELGATSGGLSTLPALERPAGTRNYMTGAEPIGNIADTLLCSSDGDSPAPGEGLETLYTASTGTNAALFAASSELATSQTNVADARQSELPYALGIGVQTFENGTVSGFTVPGFGVVPNAFFAVGQVGDSATISDNVNFIEGFPLSYSTTVTVQQSVRTTDGSFIIAQVVTSGSAGKLAFSVTGTHEFCIVNQPGKLRYASKTNYEGTMGVPTSSDATLFWNARQTINAQGLLD
ncbi:MAG: hypothetical protein ACKVS9_08030 [Phycisphaerae bacterium]